MSYEPDVVDLRRDQSDSPDHASTRAPTSRRTTLAALALIFVGGLIGWLIGSSGGASDPEDASPIVSEVTPTALGQPIEEESAVSATPRPPTDQPADSDGPTRQPIVGASVTALPGLAELAGPVNLVPGLDVGVRMQLTPDGEVTVSADVPETFSSDAAPSAREVGGYPIAQVADGLLIIPTDVALGAIVYWSPGQSVVLPVVDEPYRTSFLAADGSQGVFTSAGDVVVVDFVAGVEVLRTPASNGSDVVVHACLNVDSSLIALVSRSGKTIVIDLETGETVAEVFTDTEFYGIAWSGSEQLVHVVPTGISPVLRATDVRTSTTRDVVRLNGGGSSWKLATEGTGC